MKHMKKKAEDAAMRKVLVVHKHYNREAFAFRQHGDNSVIIQWTPPLNGLRTEVIHLQTFRRLFTEKRCGDAHTIPITEKTLTVDEKRYLASLVEAFDPINGRRGRYLVQSDAIRFGLDVAKLNQLGEPQMIRTVPNCEDTKWIKQLKVKEDRLKGLCSRLRLRLDKLMEERKSLVKRIKQERARVTKKYIRRWDFLRR